MLGSYSITGNVNNLRQFPLHQQYLVQLIQAWLACLSLSQQIWLQAPSMAYETYGIDLEKTWLVSDKYLLNIDKYCQISQNFNLQMFHFR